MSTQEMLAREAIRDLVARYNSYGDSGRIEQLTALFAPDASLEVVGRTPLAGRAAIGEFFAAVVDSNDARPPVDFIHHHSATHQIYVMDQQRARGRSYYAVYTQHGVDHWGRYIDEYCVYGGAWCFRSRRVHVDGAVAGGWGAAPMPDMPTSA